MTTIRDVKSTTEIDSETQAALAANFRAGIVVLPADYPKMMEAWQHGATLSDLEETE